MGWIWSEIDDVVKFRCRFARNARRDRDRLVGVGGRRSRSYARNRGGRVCADDRVLGARGRIADRRGPCVGDRVVRGGRDEFEGRAATIWFLWPGGLVVVDDLVNNGATSVADGDGVASAAETKVDRRERGNSPAGDGVEAGAGDDDVSAAGDGSRERHCFIWSRTSVVDGVARDVEWRCPRIVEFDELSIAVVDGLGRVVLNLVDHQRFARCAHNTRHKTSRKQPHDQAETHH